MEGEPYRARAVDGIEISLHRIGGATPPTRPPVLLAPGTFTARAFWMGARTGEGFAHALRDSGFDVWTFEPRGHGESERPSAWSLTDWIERDAPAAVRLVLRETGARDLFWVGHSAGGVVGAAASGALGAALRGLVLLGSPGPAGLRGGRRWLARVASTSARLMPGAHLPGQIIGLGPESEPASLVREWMDWNLRGAWGTPGGGDYLARLPAVTVPVLAVAGQGDRMLAPPHAVRDLLERFGSDDRTLLVFGESLGSRRDYRHASLVIGRDARAEIWPRVVEWLEARS